MIILHDFGLVMVTDFISIDARLLGDDNASKGFIRLCNTGLDPPRQEKSEFPPFRKWRLADNQRHLQHIKLLSSGQATAPGLPLPHCG